MASDRATSTIKIKQCQNNTPLTKQLARNHQLWLPTSSSLRTMPWENRFNLSNKSDERHHKNEECKKLNVSGIIKHLRYMKSLPRSAAVC
jgi:hypothetical protein